MTINNYYVKDIHKSIEALLYGLYVYQYLLDTSTFGLIIRIILQDRLLSLKSIAPSLRVTIYSILAATFLGILRHLNVPDRYAIVIDFIGNVDEITKTTGWFSMSQRYLVSTPSRTRLLCLDGLILLLQITEALIVFNFIKGSTSSERSSSSRPPRTLTRRDTRSPASRAQDTSGGPSGRLAARAGSSINQHPTTATTTSTTAISPPSSTLQSTSTASEPGPSHSRAQQRRSQSPLFANNDAGEYNGSREQGPMNEYYVDEEETRYSVDNRRPVPTIRRHGGNSNGSSIGSEQDDASDDEDDSHSESSISSLDDEYGGSEEQETFIFQLTFKDLLAYLMSSQEPITFPPPRTNSTGTSSIPTPSTNRVQDLPV